jgi:tryptophan synthase alpha chain
MTSISECLSALKRQGQCALIPFVMAGDPDLETTAQVLERLDQSGADVIELGVPYSDPLADGPVIQAAATRALQKEIQWEQVLEMVERVSPKLRSPLVLFTYYNPILNHGVEAFLSRIDRAGVKGLVIPDLPLEESAPLLTAAVRQGIEIILLVAPTSSPERMQAIAEASQGFVYLVSVTGVTGMRSQLNQDLSTLLRQLRSHTNKPIGVGFGIAKPEQAQQMQSFGADAVIVGSAFVQRLADTSLSTAQRLQSVESFCLSLKNALTSTKTDTKTDTKTETVPVSALR